MKSPTPLYRLLVLLPLLAMLLSLPPAPRLLASDGAQLSLPAMRLGQVEQIGATSALLADTDYYWHIETVDSAGDVGVSSSLAVDTAGHPHIGYHDEGNGYLKYAYHDGTTWIIGTIDSAGDLAHWNCLDLDSSGRPHIAYINAIPYADDLKYAHFVGAGGNCGPANDWQCYLVDSAGFVGGYSSLKVDTSDLPHVSYYDAGNTALKYARYVGSGGNCGLSNDWQCDTADNSANMGENSSLALDSADRPHITYYQHYIADLRYAYHDGMTWHFETVDSAGNVGTDSSLALDSSDRPHISYHDYTNGDLKYAYHDGSTWHFQTVDSLGNVGADSSLALDSTDRPHIAYYDATNGDLKYAWYDGTLWYFETVDSGGIGGGNLSLILDGAGRAHISYYDISNGDLKYASREPANRPPAISADHDAVAVNEGQTATNTGTVSDSDGDAVSLSASVGTVTNYSDGTWSWSFATSDGPAQSQTVTILADDGNGGTATTAFELTVHNVPPTIESIGAPFDPVNVNDPPIGVEVAFSDPSADDTHDVTWDWGDLTSDTQYGATSPASFSHTYGEPGVYTVQVTVTDDDGASDTGVYEFIVIYDPEGGFVTGGGWIWSEPGCCQLDDLCAGAEGKAGFGFDSKYKKGASVPVGNTEFNFKAGGLNFHSDAYQWLVVNQAGTNAQYKGSGTINGDLAPNRQAYKFMLWAKDLDPEGDDTFRIRIWYEDGESEILVYDNGFDQAIGGGNIQVHSN